MAQRHWWTTHRFGVLTAMQFVYIVSLGFHQALPDGVGRHALGELISLMLFGIASLVAVFAVSDKRAVRFTCAALFSLFTAFYLLEMWLAHPAVAVTQYVVGIGFLAYVIAFATIFFFHTPRVTQNTLFSAVSTYLMMAIAWAMAYTLIAYADPRAFNLPDGDATGFSIFQGRDGFAATPMYYSLVTLTTLGYGDITPATGPARMVSAMQAVVGQLFIAIVVARLVGLHLINQFSDDA